ncbi:MAG: hypothetical protein MUO60_09385 [Clostridiaceae bacterium]|nr:hypothetical protein [Clostridiaceae bacterium]
MTILGGIIFGAGKIVGNTAEYSIKKTGSIISTIAEISGKNKLAQNTVKYSTIASKVVGKTTKITAAITAVLVDKTIDGTINTVKYIAKNSVETNVKVYGQSEKFYDEDKYIEADYKIIDE